MPGLRYLPNREHSEVPWAKVRHYYLAEHLRGSPNSKVELFVDVLGFRDPWTLRAALLGHGRRHPVDSTSWSRYGVTYNVIGPLQGPSGRRVSRMLTAWIIEHGSNVPRNTTAFPAPRTTV